MAFPGGQDHRITLAEAAALTRRHRERAGGKGPRAFAFGREALDALLAQAGCAGLRVYLGRGEDGDTAVVLVGMDATGADLTDGEVLDRSWPCPPYCPGSSALDG